MWETMQTALLNTSLTFGDDVKSLAYRSFFAITAAVELKDISTTTTIGVVLFPMLAISPNNFQRDKVKND